MMTHHLLEGKRGIIFGAINSNSIAWAVAEQVVAEGASIVLTNTAVAVRFSDIKQLSQQLNAPVIETDATSENDLRNLLAQSQEILGGKIDFILHAVAMSGNIRKNRTYSNLDYQQYIQTINVSAISFHKLLQVAFEMDAIAEYGSVVALTFIASHRVFPNYSDMADAKAMLESITRNFGMIYGEKRNVRVNTVSQSPTITTAGSGIDGFDKFYKLSDIASPLGNASAHDCAGFCVTLFSDYTRKVTMQNLYHDGGFSSTGVSNKLIDFVDSHISEDILTSQD